MESSLYKLSQSIGALKGLIGKSDIPAVWMEIFLLVASQGEQGITTQDVIRQLDLTQGLVSRVVKMLTRYYDHDKGESAGYDLFTTAPDFMYKHRQRLFLSTTGKQIVEAMQKYL